MEGFFFYYYYFIGNYFIQRRNCSFFLAFLLSIHQGSALWVSISPVGVKISALYGIRALMSSVILDYSVVVGLIKHNSVIL